MKTGGRNIVTTGISPVCSRAPAKYYPGRAPFREARAHGFGATIEVNIKGAAHVPRHFFPTTIHRGSGKAVNFSSGWGHSAPPDVSAYYAGKWAIEGTTHGNPD